MPWREYRVGTPSTRPRWTNQECDPFTRVLHVTHIENALAIIPGGTLKPQLITDESRLNTRRLLVNWVSPNTWGTGYRYGNVAFALDWPNLLNGKRLYWVEVMPYAIPACRILVTEKDYTGDADMIPYDPTTGEGPWWWSRTDNVHYRNGHICLEFMLEFDLSAAACNAISFVKHHDQYCCIKETSCRDKGMEFQEAAGRFVAGVITKETDVRNVNIDNHAVQGGWWWLMMTWPRDGYRGATGVEANDDAALALAHSVTTTYYRRDNDKFVKLARLFATRTALEFSVKALVKAKFPEMPDDT
ncbi:MAG: hypothetical protein NT154_24865 [Verrucomicrobia bacterium]|nr:hypothetical protein [Verrucomicrobiota bacterium]